MNISSHYSISNFLYNPFKPLLDIQTKFFKHTNQWDKITFQTLKLCLFGKYFDPKWIKYRGNLWLSCGALWRIHFNFLTWLGLQMHNIIPRVSDQCSNYYRPQYREHLQDISLPNYHPISISAFEVLSKI